MEQRLKEILSGKEENYLLPFFWQHLGHTEEIPHRVQKIFESGCRAFCVESRPYEDFCGDSWWRDMGIILNEAKKRDMKVWILDDKHYPTGYANGLLEKKYPHLHRWFLREHHADCMGPCKDTALRIPRFRGDERLLGACAYRRTGNGEDICGEPLPIPVEQGDEFLYFDVPEGCWRIFLLYQSNEDVLPHSRWYVDMLSEESVHVLIEAVYESHYEHFSEYFGNTLAGFFSDEPSFDACLNSFDRVDEGLYYRTVGQPGMLLPWGETVCEAMKGDGLSLEDLPTLWYRAEGKSPQVRLSYMDAVTRQWRKNFSFQLGDWCRAHNVMYIGHVIEDMNAHARIGSSAGHYFRALEGQDMSGIDIVLHQVMPGLGQYQTAASISGSVADPEFFHYTLAQLASSLARQNPAMKGRAMCEVFGAYGWAEGTPAMKWLMDFLLVRGVNHFVPHAFTDIYPDPDCPPHFYGDGNNPQYESFAELMNYVNRMAHLLYGTDMEASGGVFYHAEAEWMEPEGRMYSQKPAKACYDAHISYDFVSLDFLEKAKAEKGCFGMPERQYRFLAVPACACLPERFWTHVRRLAAAGVPVFFVDRAPCFEGELPGEVVSLDRLASRILERGLAHSYQCGAPFLRIARFDRDGSSCFMLFNESPKGVNASVTLPRTGRYLLLDLLNGVKAKGETDSGNVFASLEPGQSELLIFDGFSEAEWQSLERPCCPKEKEGLELSWKIELMEQGREEEFHPYLENASLSNITGKAGKQDFSGNIRYTARFELKREDSGRVFLDLGEVGMTAKLALNGKELGQRICAPYRWDISGAVKDGENEIEIVVSNTLVHRVYEGLSTFMPVLPSGLIGPVVLLKE